MPNDSDSEHDASARTGDVRASHTPADADIFDQLGDELERRVALSVPPPFQRGQGNGGGRGGGGGGQVRERRLLRADLGEEPAHASDWIESFRDVHFAWNERGPAGESERSPGDDWWRSLGELDTEIDAEPTSDATAGSHKAGVWWLAPDEQLAFQAENDGLTRAVEPAGDAGAAGPAGAERGRRGAWVLAERGRRGAWVVAGFAALAILVAGTLGVVGVSRSDGSRPAGKIVSDRTTAPTTPSTTTVPVTTTPAPASETSVPANPAPSAAPTVPRPTTTSRRAPPANPDPAVTASPPPDTTPPPPPPPPPSPPPPPPPPPDTTSPPPTK